MNSPDLQITHITYSSQGGAGTAASNLSRAMTSLGFESRLVTKSAKTIPAEYRQNPVRFATAIFDFFVVRKHKDASIFSLYRSSGRPLRRELEANEILHFHWMPGVVSVRQLIKFASEGRPVVVTLHDLWPLSGGCHFRAGCNEIAKGCRSCPQSRALFHKKVSRSKELKDLWVSTGATTQFIAPSQWMAEEALLSCPELHGRIHVIPNAVDLDCFWPSEPELERLADADRDARLIVGFVASDITEKRKGFEELLSAVGKLRKDAGLDIRLRSCGGGNLQSDVPWWVHVGPIFGGEKLRNFYHQCDMVAVPSQEDNLPTVALEAGLCGVPSLTSDRTGLSPLVESIHESLTFRSLSDLLSKLAEWALKRDELSVLGLDFRSAILRTMSPQVVVKEHLSVYRSLTRSLNATN